jgi:S-adenosylmethionine:tRNA ribosyltransferase-isomerase
VLVQFSLRDGQAGTEILQSALRAAGTMPIPPYIRGGLGDEEDLTDYQTIFARHEGSIAAPTASLHFTPNLVKSLLRAGVEMAQVTLHVGAASIRALDASSGGVPGAERMQVSASVLEKIDDTRRAGGRVVAVGTTVMRALETAWRARQSVAAGGAPAPTLFEGETDLFIRPGFEFYAVDGLITNFHQPGTSHLLLVEAFVGRSLLERIYDHALHSKYRFLSYGDGSLLW